LGFNAVEDLHRSRAHQVPHRYWHHVPGECHAGRGWHPTGPGHWPGEYPSGHGQRPTGTSTTCQAKYQSRANRPHWTYRHLCSTPVAGRRPPWAYGITSATACQSRASGPTAPADSPPQQSQSRASGPPGLTDSPPQHPTSRGPAAPLELRTHLRRLNWEPPELTATTGIPVRANPGPPPPSDPTQRCTVRHRHGEGVRHRRREGAPGLKASAIAAILPVQAPSLNSARISDLWQDCPHKFRAFGKSYPAERARA